MMSLSRKKKKRRLDPTTKNAILSMTLVLLFCGFGFALYNVCLDRQIQFEKKIVELDSVRAQHHDLVSHNERMRERVKFLRTPLGVEEVAREKLGMVRPGELAYSVVPPPPSQFGDVESIASSSSYSVKGYEAKADKGAVIRILRHLFGRPVDAEKVST